MKRNKFSLSHYVLMSMKPGNLVPCGITEVLPGDTFQHATSVFIRLSPLVAPVMHPVHIKLHHWFVPHRLIWDSAEDFYTGGADGLQTPAFPTITLNTTNNNNYSLADYLGMPPLSSGTYVVSALPFRGYSLIYNEWYRDADLTTPLAISKANGADVTTNTTMQNVAWGKDYFTTSRPWAQKGTQITVPVNVQGIGTDNATNFNAGVSNPVRESGRTTTTTYSPFFNSATGAVLIRGVSGGGTGAYPDIQGQMQIRDLRLALAMQKWEEARARYGSRYVEYLRYMGVRSSDARLQRPEYLGGGKQTIQFSEVLQTAPSAAPAASVGALKGHGIAGLRTNRYRRFFEEHGYVYSFVSVAPIPVYNQSLHRSFNRRVREDFWIKELEGIGQQAVLNKELYATSDTGVANATGDGTFGYQDRYDEYRKRQSYVTGEFRRTTLDYWHMARKFTTQPTLNSSFVVANPTNRIFADQSGTDTLYLMVSHSIQARRLVGASGTPRIA